MEQRDFWGGFVAGASAVVAGVLLAGKVSRGGDSRVLRLGKSLQIARPVNEVFEAWINFKQLARSSSLIEDVRTTGNRSHWTADLNGVRVEWDAELTQIFPNQSIAWKSVKGPHHSGRVTFGPLGSDTLVHVQMNYAPPVRFLRRMFAPLTSNIEDFIEQALRDFKAELEATTRDERGEAFDAGGSDPSNAHWNVGQNTAPPSGTYGPGPELLTNNENAKFGQPGVPVEYTRPPDAKR